MIVASIFESVSKIKRYKIEEQKKEKKCLEIFNKNEKGKGNTRAK